MLKRVDIAVYNTIELGVNGELQGGSVLQYGLDVDGVSLSEMTYTRHIIPREYMDQVETMRQQILSGELEVIDIRTLDAETFAIVDSDPTCAGVEALKAAVAE
jgi:basic membrane lipoprotein Med (substrate-binding protein (PBP1-ABC) superfamily)